MFLDHYKYCQFDDHSKSVFIFKLLQLRIQNLIQIHATKLSTSVVRNIVLFVRN
jgi:hypothetical protein